jgi:chromosome segregation ATPase
MQAHAKRLEDQNNTHFSALESRITAQMQQVATELHALAPLPSQMHTLRQDVVTQDAKIQDGKNDTGALKQKVDQVLASISQIQQAVGAAQGQIGVLQEQVKALRHDMAYTRWHEQEVEEGVVARLEAVQVRMDVTYVELWFLCQSY